MNYIVILVTILFVCMLAYFAYIDETKGKSKRKRNYPDL
jgi:hypothetical protein